MLDTMTKRWLYKKESYLDNLNRLLDPKSNHFESTTNMNDIPPKTQGKGQELWTDGKSVMIASVLGGFGGKNPHLEAYMDRMS